MSKKKPQVYRKGDSERVVRTVADEVSAKFDGYKLVEPEETEKTEGEKPEAPKPTKPATKNS